MPEKAHASPTKQFFISMITKDIALEDCILDLLDNSIDGARNYLRRQDQKKAAEGLEVPDRAVAILFEGFKVEIEFANDHFRILDNCGGVPVADAIDYAFHFGRRRDAVEDAAGGIGLYGIGMKRAIFKMGRDITVSSSTEDEAFVVPIDVDEWEKDPAPTSKEAEGQENAADVPNANLAEWDFDLTRVDKGSIGTEIVVRRLNKGIGDEFADQTFSNHLVETIARDYSIFLQRGLQVTVNRSAVTPYPFALLESADFQPVRTEYEDDGVKVEIIAGLSKTPDDDDSADVPYTSDVDYYGWFVACNDRIVLAGNKTDTTVWGDPTDRFPAWHPQYNGFMGMAFFSAADPNLLPWTTTKRNVDTTMAVYRRAIVKMKAATRQFINYTNTRKLVLEDARKLEEIAVSKPISALPSRETIRVPIFTRRDVANISYAVKMSQYKEVAKALGNPDMSRKEVGLRTFEYYRQREVGDQ